MKNQEDKTEFRVLAREVARELTVDDMKHVGGGVFGPTNIYGGSAGPNQLRTDVSQYPK